MGSFRVVVSTFLQEADRMIDDIILEDIEKVKSAVKGDVFSEKKVLVTGGAGFIGSWLKKGLVNCGN
ncbi:hypothetical protein IMZ68_02790 [Candidatus Bathyarchaeota archaeon]|nr:hypothetical protein [Candidatus Bathyarchaeota archaeon]